MIDRIMASLLSKAIGLRKNDFHPLVWLNGEPAFGVGVYIGGFTIVNAKGSSVTIGNHCDIASFVSINCADSHKRCIGLADDIERKPIIIGDNVFIGSHAVVKGGAHIGHHSVIAAGAVVDGVAIPPYSLVTGNPMTVKDGYYRNRLAQ